MEKKKLKNKVTSFNSKPSCHIIVLLSKYLNTLVYLKFAPYAINLFNSHVENLNYIQPKFPTQYKPNSQLYIHDTLDPIQTKHSFLYTRNSRLYTRETLNTIHMKLLTVFSRNSRRHTALALDFILSKISTLYTRNSRLYSF